MTASLREIRPLTLEAAGRRAERPISPSFLERWSSRAFTAEPIAEETLLALFEAARWAPSAYNSQPWRFVYALRDTPAWPGFVATLNPYNQTWAPNAAALIVVLSDPHFTPPGQEAPVKLASASFDVGAAWASFALQAHEFGWVTHAIGGFDADAARRLVNAPDDYRVEALVAIGKRGDPATLSDALRAREVPNQRRPIAETVFSGKLG